MNENAIDLSTYEQASAAAIRLLNLHDAAQQRALTVEELEWLFNTAHTALLITAGHCQESWSPERLKAHLERLRLYGQTLIAVGDGLVTHTS